MTNQTPLPVAKWTKSSLIKCLERNYSDSFAKLVKLNLPKDEFNQRAGYMLQIFLSMYEPIMKYGVVIKK